MAGHWTSPILLKSGMQSCFRVLTTLNSFNSFYFGKISRRLISGVTLAARQYGGSKEFLLHQYWSCHRNFSTILVTDIKSYPSLSYLWKQTRKMINLNDQRPRNTTVFFPSFEKFKICFKLEGWYLPCYLDWEVASYPECS